MAYSYTTREFIGAPESARLLNQSPSFWVDRLGQESAMAAAVNLQRDAGFMMTNLQILGQFVMSLHRMSAEMLSIGVDHVVFPVDFRLCQGLSAQPSTCRRWACGALCRVRVHPGHCRCRPARRACNVNPVSAEEGRRLSDN